MFREKCKQALWQIPVLIVMAGLVALCVNYLRSDGIALVGDWSVDKRFPDTAGAGMVIDLEEAGRLFEQDAATFLDARPHDQYALGHIRGALSIPWQEVDRYFNEAVDRLKAGRVMITYCDGETCDLSHELALFLKDMGFKNVHVLVNGWTVWQQAGLPTQKEE
ncbi:MAG: rhodanese-like domain-containing protein [Desulfobacteraceae bacterium]|nr:MAG: rhodanese-like domain-containing protein [Desulfobacteraceae bacterium]